MRPALLVLVQQASQALPVLPARLELELELELQLELGPGRIHLQYLQH